MSYYKETRKDELVILTVLSKIINSKFALDNYYGVVELIKKHLLETPKLKETKIIVKDGNLLVEYENPNKLSKEEITYLIRSNLNKIIRLDELTTLLNRSLECLFLGYKGTLYTGTLGKLNLIKECKTIKELTAPCSIKTNIKNLKFVTELDRNKNYLAFEPNIKYKNGWALKNFKTSINLNDGDVHTKSENKMAEINYFYFYCCLKSFINTNYKRLIKGKIIETKSLYEKYKSFFGCDSCKTFDLHYLIKRLNILKENKVLTYKVNKPFKLFNYFRKNKLDYSIELDIKKIDLDVKDIKVKITFSPFDYNNLFFIDKIDVRVDNGTRNNIEIINTIYTNLFILIFFIHSGYINIDPSYKDVCTSSAKLVKYLVDSYFDIDVLYPFRDVDGVTSKVITPFGIVFESCDLNR